MIEKDKLKLHLTTSLIVFWVYECLHNIKNIGRFNYKEIKKGDWIVETSSIHGGRRLERVGWDCIGKVISFPKGKTEGDGFVIKTLSGKKVNWDNASFLRLPEEVQERFKNIGY